MIDLPAKDTFFCKNLSLNCKGKLLSLHSPVVMGIVNLTPDSFFDGGNIQNKSDFLHKVEQIIKDGALIVDLGGCSTRPGAQEIPVEEEKKRLLPYLSAGVKEFPNVIFSADTYRSEIARQAIEEGASIINDISGGDFDKNMFQTVCELNVPYILMHTSGKPDIMQKNPYYDNVVTEVLDTFIKKVATLTDAGLHDIIIDPGFGFGKTVEHNLSLLKNLNTFRVLNLPILAGLSRKSMINKVLGIKSVEALNGTTIVNTIALFNGASILRVHDVKEAMEAIKIFEAMKDL